VTVIRRATLLICLISCSAVGQGNSQAPQMSSAGLSGVVCRSDSSAVGLAGAQVTLTPLAPSTAVSTLSDEAGRFSFPQVVGGYYRIDVTRTGFLPTTYGSKGPNMPGLPILVSPGENHDVVIAMTPGAAITGTVRDRFGASLGGVRVVVHRVLAASEVRSGTLSKRSRETRTNSMGAYTVGGLVEGSYVVAALPDQKVRQFDAPTSDHIDAMLSKLANGARAIPVPPTNNTPGPVFYPATPLQSRASLVVVRTGAETSGIDIQFGPIRVASIRGAVFSESGALLPGVDIRIAAMADPPGFELGSRRTISDSHGAFAARELRPGSYYLIASVPGSPGSAFRNTVELSEGEDRVLDLRLRPMTSVSGRASIDGKPDVALDFTKTEVLAEPFETTSGFSGSATAMLRPDGTFEIGGLLPGRYRISFRKGIADRFWLKRVTTSGVEVLDVGLEIDTQPTVELVVLFSSARTSLTGTIKNKAGDAAPNLLVVVFPRDPTLWTPGSRRLAVSTVAPDGSYVVRDLPAGDYYVAALVELDEESFGAPWYLEGLRPYSIPIALAEGEHRKLDLELMSR
jgi:hypothetical protein